MSVVSTRTSLGADMGGRPFVNPVFDYLLIGGGLSLLATGVVLARPTWLSINAAVAVPYLALLSNSCHFAASTVRLYTKPGSRVSLPFLTMLFPLVTLVILTACIAWAESVGNALMALYLTWSPYHYAAQAYGLAVMYSYRSGCVLAPGDKKLLWWVSMLPFFYTFLFGAGTGLDWLIHGIWASIRTQSSDVLLVARYGLVGLAFAAPLLLFFKVARSRAGMMPLISLLMILANSVWFLVLGPLDAFVWATIFHGIQYLAIVIIFHVKDQMARPDNRHGPWFHIVTFYLMCLALGYGLFQCLPWAYAFSGFGHVESILLVAAAINVHHFIVDAYIWRLKKTDGNRKIVDEERTASGASSRTAAAV